MKAGNRAVRWVTLLGFGALAVAGQGSAGAATATVTMKGSTFRPPTITIAPGDTVVWKNDDTTAHSVVFDDGSYDSHPRCTPGLLGGGVNCMNPGEEVQRTFNAPGDFSYKCRLHAPRGTGMVGIVSVKAAEVTATSKPAQAAAPAPTTTTRPPASTTTRPLATSSTMPSSTTTTLPAETTTTLTPNEAPAFDPDDSGARGSGQGEPEEEGEEAAPASASGDGSGSGTLVLIVALLLAVAGGGGLLLWRLRPRQAP